jgi:hypothetical protein
MLVGPFGWAAGAGTCGHAIDALHSKLSNAVNRVEVSGDNGIIR